MKRGYEERHYDAMLITFAALNISEHRLKPEACAQEARARADAFIAELVKIDEESEAESRALSGGEDLTHENADRDGDTEPPPAPGQVPAPGTAVPEASAFAAQQQRLEAQAAESKALDDSLHRE